MPLIHSSYNPKFPFTNTHFNTVFRTFFTYDKIQYKRERIELKDGDFMDIDFSTVGAKTAVILLSGLEGNSQSKYILSSVKFLNKNNIDTISVNYRGCSGEANRTFASYHSGKTEDLQSVLTYIKNHHSYNTIVLLGFSLGGNLTLKLTGQYPNLNPEIKCTIAVSVPCDLKGSSTELAKRRNSIYMHRFLRTLKSKTLKKLKAFPNNKLNKEAIKKARNFKEYDSAYTAPANGFLNADDYWRQASSKPYLNDINIPTLLINALDDTFLSPSCYPFEIANEHQSLFLETPKFGGHVGFNQNLENRNEYWLEKKILSFMQENLDVNDLK